MRASFQAMALLAVAPWPVMGVLAGIIAALVVGVVVYGRIAEHAPGELQVRLTNASRQLIVSLMLLTPLVLGALLDAVGPTSMASIAALALGLAALALTVSRTMRYTVDAVPAQSAGGGSDGGE